MSAIDEAVEVAAQATHPHLWNGKFRDVLLRFTGKLSFTEAEVDERVESKRQEARDKARAVLTAALPVLVESIAQEIDRLTVSQETLNHPYPIDAATAEAAAIVRNYGKAEA